MSTGRLLGIALAASVATAGCKPGLGVGYSAGTDPDEVGKAATEQAIAAMDGGKPDLVLVYESLPESGARLIETIRSVAGNKVPIVGCSTYGQLTHIGIDPQTEPYKYASSAAICAIKGPGSNVKYRYFPAELGKGIGSALAGFAKETEADLVLLLAAPDMVYGEDPVDLIQVFEILRDTLGRVVPVIGGIAGGPNKEGGKAVLYDGTGTRNDGMVAVTFSGLKGLSFDARHALRPVGEMLAVTRSRGRKVLRVGGKNPKETLEKIFKKESPKEAFYHMGIEVGSRLVNMGFSFDKRGAMDFSRHIPAGTRMQPIVGDVVGEMDCLPSNREGLATVVTGDELALFLIGCVSRVPPTTEAGAAEERLLAEYAGDIPVFGFFAGGEIGPVPGNDGLPVNQFHHSSAVFAGIK